MTGQVYEFERLPAETVQKDYPSVWATGRAALPGLSDEDLAVVVSLAVGTCSYCHEAGRKCKCWNDE